MNEHTERWQRQLELATSRPATDGETLDAETAELREGWSSLSRLLEAADTDVAEKTLLVHTQMARRQRLQHWLGIVALAAALLLAVSGAWLGLRSGQRPSRPSSSDMAGSSSQPTPSAAPTTLPRSISPNDEIRWDDAWDEKLAQVDQSLASLHHGLDLGDTSFQIVDQQLQQLSQEMKTEL